MAHKNEQGWDPSKNIGLGVERRNNRVIMPETSESSKIEVDPGLLAEARKLEARPRVEAELPGALAQHLESAESYMNRLQADRAQIGTVDAFAAKERADRMKGGVALNISASVEERWRTALAGFDHVLGNQFRWTNVVRRAKSVMDRAAREAGPGKVIERAQALLNESEAAASYELAVRHQNLIQLWQTANELNTPVVWETYNTKHREFQEDSESLASIAEARQLIEKEAGYIEARALTKGA